MAEQQKPIEDEEVEQPVAEETAPKGEEEASAPAEEEASVPAEEEAPAMANRDKFLANLRAKYPDIEDEEGLYDAAMSGYDAEHEYAKQQREETGHLAEIMQNNPELAAMYAEMFERGKDGNPEMALINISDLLKDYISGNISGEEYENKKKESAKAEADKQAKMEAQDKVFREVCEEEGLDYDETLGKLAEVLLKPMAAYEIGKEQVKNLINMINYDEDVAAARVQGRNEQIEAKKRKLERSSDGLPSGQSAPTPAQKPERESMLNTIASRRAAAKNL